MNTDLTWLHRLLINLQQVGELGSRADDVLLLGDCDSGVRKLAEACGWLEELEAVWAETARDEDRAAEAAAAAQAAAEASGERTKEDKLADEVEKLTREVEETLKLSESHTDFVNTQLGRTTEASEKKAPLDTVATAEAYTTQPSLKPASSKVLSSFASRVESDITSQLTAKASSIGKSIKHDSPGSKKEGQSSSSSRIPDAQWTFAASDSSAQSAEPGPSLALFVASSEEDIDASVRSTFTHSSDLRVALAITFETSSSKTANIKLWAHSADDGSSDGGSKPTIELDTDFRSMYGEVIDGKVVIPLTKFLSSAEVAETNGVTVELPFRLLVGWLEEAEGTSVEGGSKI